MPPPPGNKKLGLPPCAVGWEGNGRRYMRATPGNKGEPPVSEGIGVGVVSVVGSLGAARQKGRHTTG